MKRISNQRGVSLIGVVIASALVAIAALAIGRYVVSLNRASVNISNSAKCQSITKSINDHITKDGNSLFINSFGPSTGQVNFPANMGGTIEGYFRMHSNIPIISNVTVLTNATHSANFRVPNTWVLNNSLNINNSINRLIAMATPNASGSQKAICCDDVDLSDPNCGDIIFDSQNAGVSVAGIPTDPENTPMQVRLAVEFRDRDGDACNGRFLDPAQLPVFSRDGAANYAFRVTLNPNTPQEEVCEGSGSTIYSTDTSPPLTQLHIDTTGWCQGVPTAVSCATGPTSDIPINIEVRTVESSTACTNCLGSLGIPSCTSPVLAPWDPTNAACTACRPSDPGSIFFCRIGERNWFANNPNYWEPCHSAIVHDYNSTTGAPVPAGVVEITYTPESPTGTVTERQTRARITLRNLTADRAYQVDVRAIDTRGVELGPSFCSRSGSCQQGVSLLPAFVVNLTNPVLAPLFVENEIAPAREGNPSSDAETVFTGQYQCNNVPISWSTTASYAVPAGAYGDFGIEESCEAILPGSTNTACSCFGSTCVAQAEGFGNTSRNFSLSVTSTNACNRDSDPENYGWCYDPVLSFRPTIGVTGEGPSPTFSHTVPAEKTACGLAFQCPIVGGNPISTYWGLNGCDAIPRGWDPPENSGCLESPLPQYCNQTQDPCGRTASTNLVSYESTLAQAPTKHVCSTIRGDHAVGNRCASGYCNNIFECHSTCLNDGLECNNLGTPSGNPSNPCSNPTDCPGRHGSCSTTYRCVAPEGTQSQDCTLNGTCGISNGCRFRDVRCVGGARDGFGCVDDSDCTGGTCNVINAGQCEFTGLVCPADGVCPNINGTCEIDVQGTCSCPNNLECERCPVPGGSGDEVFCPDLTTCAIPKPAILPANLTCGFPKPPPPPGTCISVTGTCNAACGQNGTRTIERFCVGGSCVGCTNSTVACTNPCTAAWDYDETCDIGTQTCPAGQCTCTVNGTTTISNLRCVYSDGNVDATGAACGAPPTSGGACTENVGVSGCTPPGGGVGGNGGCGHCVGRCCLRGFGGSPYPGLADCPGGMTAFIRCR